MAKRRKGVGDKQAEIVMRTFAKGKLRDPRGKKISSSRQAKAVAMSEKRAAEERGVSKRVFKGRNRIRPRKKV